MFTSIHLLLTFPFPTLPAPAVWGHAPSRLFLGQQALWDKGRPAQGDWVPGEGGGGRRTLQQDSRVGVGMDQKQRLAVSRLTLSPLPVTPRQVQ